jgi:hypothetical protein
LGPYDRESLKLDACSVMGWRVLERREIASILEQGPSVAAVTLVVAHLIRHPDAGTAESVFGQLEQRPLPASPDDPGAHVALLCMAGVNGLGARVRQEAGLLGWVEGGKFAGWSRVTELFGGAARPRDPAAFLPALHQLPLEVVYALTAHYRAAAEAGAGPAGPRG